MVLFGIGRRVPFSGAAARAHRRGAGVEIVQYSASLTVRCRYPETVVTRYRVGPEQAHTLVDGPRSWLWARVCEPLLGRRGLWESAWQVTALGLIEAEAEDALTASIERLCADIDAGNIRPGTHPKAVPRDPLEPTAEAQLRGFRSRFTDTWESV